MKASIVALTLAAVAALLQTPNTRAQATNPPYLSQFPSAARVKAEIKGTDAMDTAARQMGAFWQLQKIIETLSGLRWARNELTPAEGRLLGEYRGGYHEVAKPYASYPDKPKWFNAHSFYEVDDGFRDELFERFLSPALREQFFRVKGETRAIVDARKAARAQALKEEQAQQAQAREELERQFKPPAWKQQLARCIASGRSESQCFTEQLGNDFQKMFPIAKNKARPAGLSMSGVYSGAGGLSVTFGPTGAFVTCKSVTAGAGYVVRNEGSQVQVRLLQPSAADALGFGSEALEKLVPKTPGANPDEWQGQRVALPVRPDGKLAGSGTLKVTGQVVVGHTTQQVTEEKRISEFEAKHYATNPKKDVLGWYVDEQVSKTVPVYAPKTEQCSLGLLTATGKMPLVGPSMSTTMATAFELMGGNTAPGESVKVPEPGLRMSGRYAGPSGFEVEFHPESAVIGCRQATVARDYSVSTNAGRVLVNIQNGGTPLVLELRPDGALAGSGPVQVSGRVWAGSNANNEPVFQPVTDTCDAGVLTPAQSDSAGTAAPTAPVGAPPSAPTQPYSTPPARQNNAPAASTPSATAANAVLTINDGFAVPPGTPSPFAGQIITLWKESWENVVRKAGVRPPPGTSAIKVWLNACATRQPLCQQVIASASSGSSAVAPARFDAGRQAQFPAVPPGTYYVFAAARYNNQPFMWDMRVDLKPGPNAVTLNQPNSTPVN